MLTVECVEGAIHTLGELPTGALFPLARLEVERLGADLGALQLDTHKEEGEGWPIFGCGDALARDLQERLNRGCAPVPTQEVRQREHLREEGHVHAGQNREVTRLDDTKEVLDGGAVGILFDGRLARANLDRVAEHLAARQLFNELESSRPGL